MHISANKMSEWRKEDMVFNATFNNILVIQKMYHGGQLFIGCENHKPVASH